MQEKTLFLQKARSLGVIIRAVFKLGDRFMRFEFPFGRREKLGLLRILLITTASSASPAVDIFSVLNASVSVEETFILQFFCE